MGLLGVENLTTVFKTNRDSFSYLTRGPRAGCLWFAFAGLTLSAGFPEMLRLRSLRWVRELQPSSPHSEQEREGVAETATLVHSINMYQGVTICQTRLSALGDGCEQDTKSLSSWVHLTGRGQAINKYIICPEAISGMK